MIEMLISLAIMSMIMLLIASGIKLISQSWDRNVNRIEARELIKSLEGVFRRDIEGIRKIIIKRNGVSSYIFSGNEKEIEFITKEPAYPTVPGLYQVRYSEKFLSKKKSLLRQRRLYRENDGQSLKKPFGDNVSFSNKGFSHTFSYGQIIKERIIWAGEWKKDKLPDLVKLQINKNNRLAGIPLIVRIKVDAEQECISSRVLGCSLNKGAGKQSGKGQTK